MNGLLTVFFRVSLLAACLLAFQGCMPNDLLLFVGKWENGEGNVNFGVDKFTSKTRFTFGEMVIDGHYRVDDTKSPKEIDLTVSRVRYLFTGSGGEERTLRQITREDARAIYDEGLARAMVSGVGDDVIAMRKLYACLESLALEASLPGIYQLHIDYGTYLQLAYSLPWQERPWDFGAGYVLEEY